MNIIDFILHFPNEDSCKIFLKDYRQKTGVTAKLARVFPSTIGFRVGNSSNEAFIEEGHP